MTKTEPPAPTAETELSSNRIIAIFLRATQDKVEGVCLQDILIV